MTPSGIPGVGQQAAQRVCWLCGGKQLQVVERIAPAVLAKAWSAFNVTFSKEAWQVFEGISEVELHRCESCGFRFCDARLAGTGTFYAELERQRTVYYPAEVPEFVRTVHWARQHGVRRVLDIGCGDGAFLDLARKNGLEVAGVELNLQAAEAVRKKGHPVYTKPLEELLGAPGVGRFDLVTLFQVLEHVPRPVEFLRQAARFLEPGGLLSVAVPNDSGIYRLLPKEPHQWPPHHLSRWRRNDLRQLGSLCQLEVRCVGANRLFGEEGEHFWKVRNQIAAAIGECPLPGGAVLPAVLSFLYRKLGLRYFIPAMGTSVYALYQSPRL